KEFDMALENELIKLNVHSTKAAKAELDLEKIKYENGTFTGLKEQTDTWLTQKSFLIKTGETKINYSPDNG
ncbi:TPA: phage scaffolding protein, partial [Clostridioides difficile]|nr:phage scaffolding protein [Clostridioides difficile]